MGMAGEAPRKLAFVLTATDHGAMLVNRMDYNLTAQGGYGVGYQLLETGVFDPLEVMTVVELLKIRRKHHGDGVMALDCGANIGVHTIEWAKLMTGWGNVLAFEAQERVFCALVGNITINNCFNARAMNVALSSSEGTLAIPQPDYRQNASFGSLELKKRANTENIGQAIDYAPEALVQVRQLAIDSLNYQRLDLIKIDVEGMELEVLAGAEQTIKRCRPIMLIECIKTDQVALRNWLEFERLRGDGPRHQLPGDPYARQVPRRREGVGSGV